MKGIVFTLLEQTVSEEHGAKVWDSLLEAAGLDGAFTSVGSYPDEDLMKLVAAASSALGVDEDDVLLWFGRKALPLLAERYPEVFEGQTSTHSFILTLNEVIHPAVRKLFPGAYAPEFEFNTSKQGVVSLAYASKRKLCAFAEGLINGASEHFGDNVRVVHESCMKRGDEKCVLAVSFSQEADAVVTA